MRDPIKEGSAYNNNDAKDANEDNKDDNDTTDNNNKATMPPKMKPMAARNPTAKKSMGKNEKNIMPPPSRQAAHDLQLLRKGD